MADRRLAVVASFLFCALVAVLLYILYHPDTSDIDDVSEEQWTRQMTIKSSNYRDETSEVGEPPVSKIALVAEIFEHMGAGFLALLAVICVSFGLFCLTCACCCFK